MAQGLTLAAELAEMMRGKIWFESEEGKGTTFHFTAYFSLPSENAGMPKEAGRKEVCGLSALVLEDNEACRAVLGEMLARWEVKVDLVESAQVALKLLEKASAAGEPYDVVIMDEDLPEIDGIVLAQRMGEKQGHFGALVVLLGSAGEPAEAAQWKDLGAAACVTKPVKESELLHALTELSAAAPPPA